VSGVVKSSARTLRRSAKAVLMVGTATIEVEAVAAEECAADVAVTSEVVVVATGIAIIRTRPRAPSSKDTCRDRTAITRQLFHICRTNELVMVEVEFGFEKSETGVDFDSNSASAHCFFVIHFQCTTVQHHVSERGGLFISLMDFPLNSLDRDRKG
jgi:hypothetical protein